MIMGMKAAGFGCFLAKIISKRFIGGIN